MRSVRKVRVVHWNLTPVYHLRPDQPRPAEGRGSWQNGLASRPPEHRWLPLFWSLDYFKSAAERDRRQGGWTMAPVDEAAVPPAHRAPEAFREAMDAWDEKAADAAVTALARTAGAGEIFEPFFRFGARDFRSIGHKAIYAANCWRMFPCIGRHHAEPVLRSLAYALLMHEGGNPAQRDAEADRPYRRNLELVERIGPEWRGGKPDDGATESLLETLRSGSNDEACDHVVELLGKGVAPQSIWDALFVGAGELLLKQPAIVPLHAVTTTNALWFAFQAAADDRTRQLMLLQNAAFLPMFREAARVLIFRKGTNAHDYKSSSAVLEDYYHVSAKWHDVYLASNVPRHRGSQAADNPLVERTRAALGES